MPSEAKARGGTVPGEGGDTLKRRTKLVLALAAAGGIAAWLAVTTEPSDWRYPKLLLTQLPKMPFRYFV